MPLRIRWGGLRAKIIAWSFVPTVIVLMAVTWVTFTAYQRVTEDLIVERNQGLTHILAGDLAARLSDYTSLLTEYTGLIADLARTGDLFTDLGPQHDTLRRIRYRFSVFDGGVLVLDNQGSVVAADPARPETMLQDWSDRSYFRHMLHSPEPVFSNVVADGPDGAEVIVLAVPIKGERGQFVGTMAGMFRLDAATDSPLYRDITALRAGDSDTAYLVDGSGRVIYHSDLERIGDDFSSQAIVQQVLRGDTGALRTHDAERHDIVASFAPIPGTPWGLVTEATWAELTSSSRNYQRFLLLLLALGVVVPALVVAVGVRRITRPIAELINAAQGVTEGHFSQTIRVSTGDELEDLARQFNVMSAELQESYAHLEQRVADRTRELAALNAIAGVVSRSLNQEEILNGGLEKTIEVTGTEAGGIYLLQRGATRKKGGLTITAHLGLSPDLVAKLDGLEVGEGFSGRVVQTGEPLVIGDIASDRRLTHPAAREAGFHSMAVVPLVSRRTVLGSLFVVTRERRDFSRQDIELLTSIGGQIGVAVENAQLFGQVERRMQELEALYRADAELHRRLSLDEVLQALVDITVEILRADKSSLYTWDERHERLVVRVARGFHPETMEHMSFSPDEGTVGYVATSSEPVIVEDARTDPRTSNRVTVMETEGIRSLMEVPIKVGGDVFGVFSADYARPRGFGDDEQRLFIALAQRAALAIDTAQLYEQSQELAVVEERQRLARDLHDAVTQTLFSASLIAEALPSLWESDPDEGRDLLGELRRLSRGALAEMRTLLLELRPASLVETDLADLLRQLAEAVSGRTGLSIMVDVETRCDPPPDVHVALYRIAQEALNNVVKHANATRVMIELCRSPLPGKGNRRGPSMAGEGGEDKRGLELTISDDGCGFDPSCVPIDGLGLDIMHERARSVGARLSIESQPGLGTRVVVTWEQDRG